MFLLCLGQLTDVRVSLSDDDSAFSASTQPSARGIEFQPCVVTESPKAVTPLSSSSKSMWLNSDRDLVQATPLQLTTIACGF